MDDCSKNPPVANVNGRVRPCHKTLILLATGGLPLDGRLSRMRTQARGRASAHILYYSNNSPVPPVLPFLPFLRKKTFEVFLEGVMMERMHDLGRGWRTEANCFRAVGRRRPRGAVRPRRRAHGITKRLFDRERGGRFGHPPTFCPTSGDSCPTSAARLDTRKSLRGRHLSNLSNLSNLFCLTRARVRAREARQIRRSPRARPAGKRGVHFFP